MIALLGWLWLAEPSAAGCAVVRGGTVHLPDGTAAVRDVRLVDDRVSAVGEGLADTHLGSACDVVDARGKHVTAGLIEVDSQLGVREVDLEDATVDVDAEIADPVRAALRVADAYDPRSTLIPVQRMGGVTSAIVVPSGGRVSGQAAHASLAGATQAEAVRDPSVAVYATLEGPSRAQALRELRQVLDDARAFRVLKPSWERGQARELAADGPDLEALWPVLDREIPLVVRADRAADLEALLRLAADQRIRLVIVGAAEGHLLAAQLAAAGVAVVVDPYVYGAGSFDQVHGRPDNAALLAAAGVKVMLSTAGSHNARLLPQAAGNAVRGGLDPEVALAAIGRVPAEVFGLDGRGRLEAGAWADVVVWSGDPLELTSWPEAVWIQGRRIAMESRQTRLRDAYRTLPGTPRPAPAP